MKYGIIPVLSPDALVMESDVTHTKKAVVSIAQLVGSEYLHSEDLLL
jgi:hypothetical protein